MAELFDVNKTGGYVWDIVNMSGALFQMLQECYYDFGHSLSCFNRSQILHILEGEVRRRSA
jgi:hypothetical protein